MKWRVDNIFITHEVDPSNSIICFHSVHHGEINSYAVPVITVFMTLQARKVNCMVHTEKALLYRIIVFLCVIGFCPSNVTLASIS